MTCQDDPPSSPRLSVVVLCYQSGAAARPFATNLQQTLEAAGIEAFELVLVANYVPGSGDRTPEVVAELARSDPRIRFTARPKEGWMGWDMRSGLALARGDFIAVIDGDGQMPVADVPVLYDLLRSSQDGGEPLDLVKTFRTQRGDSIWRKLISNVFNEAFRVLFPGLRSRDINSKPKVMTRAFYERLELTSDDWFVDTEIMIQARRLGARIGEVPTSFIGLTGRRSFIGPRAIVEFIVNLARYRVREFRHRAPG